MLDRETIETVLALINPLHGSLDRQVMNQLTDEHEFDAPSDREYNVNVTARQERDLTQAVCILENRLRNVQLKPQPVAWVIPGDGNANDKGFIDAMAWQEGEFTQPLYTEPRA